MSLPIVSVIVPTYNYERFIEHSLMSLRAQTYPHWECVVIDDGSTDKTEEVVRRHGREDERIKYLRQRNQRQAAAKNNGLRNSRGEYVQFLDADDAIEPLKFERQVAFLQAHPEVDIVYSGVRFFSDERPNERRLRMDGVERPWMPEISGSGAEMVSALLRENIMVINSPLVRRSVITDVGPFDDALPPAEDWDYWLRSAIAGKRFHYEDREGMRALVRYHRASSSSDRVRMYDSTLRMRGKIDALLEDDGLRRLNRDNMVLEHGLLGFEEVTRGHRLNGVKNFMRAGAKDRKLNVKLRWWLCALAAPFLTERALRNMAALSLPRALARVLRRESASS